MRFFLSKNNSIKTAIITYLITLIGFASTIFLFFKEMMDVPFGILLGGGVFGSLALISGLIEKKDEERNTPIFSIIMIAIRFLLLVVLTIIIALMYYKWNLKVFNVFAFVGAYLASTIAMIIVYLVYRKEA